MFLSDDLAVHILIVVLMQSCGAFTVADPHVDRIRASLESDSRPHDFFFDIIKQFGIFAPQIIIFWLDIA